MNRNHELTGTHHPLDRHSAPKRSHVSKHMHNVLCDRRNSFLSEQTFEEIEEARREADRDAPLRERAMPSDIQVKAIWQQQIGKAKMISGQVIEDDLLKNQGQIDRFAGLVQERYAIPRAEAEKQVAAFLRKRHS